MRKLISTNTAPIDSRGNPYLEGPHGPTRDEIDALDLEVIGDVPKDLDGIYLRNGPNQRHDPLGVHHWFDGDGMLHGVTIGDGKISYRNRWIRTRGLQVEEQTGRAVWPGIIDKPDRSLPQAWGSDRNLKDSSNTDVVFHNGKAVTTFYQCGDPYAVDPRTLATMGVLDVGNGGLRSMSAHNMVDERTGEMMFFDYATQPPYMTYGVLDAHGRLSNHTEIELPGARLPHTLAITRNHTILMDLPLFWDPELLKQDAHKVTFHAELPSRFGVIPRHGGGSEVRWFEAEPTYIYHIVNAWEDGERIVLDGCKLGHPEPSQDDRRRYAGPYASLMAWMKLDASYHRWIFDLRTGVCTERRINDLISEFPMINSSRNGEQTRYSYHVSFADADTVLFDGLVKYDSESGAVTRYRFPPGHYGSEAPFAPQDDSQAEDDGYVVTFVSIPSEQRAELQVFDARGIEHGPLCRALIPNHIASGFHSCWITGERLHAG